MRYSAAAAIFVAVLLSGCVDGNPHDPASWAPPQDANKATSDWDIAEAMCDKVALETELTEEEVAIMEEEVQSAREAINAINETSPDTPESGIEGGARLVGGVLAFFTFNKAVTAGERKKQEAFLDCMHGFGWQLQS